VAFDDDLVEVGGSVAPRPVRQLNGIRVGTPRRRDVLAGQRGPFGQGVCQGTEFERLEQSVQVSTDRVGECTMGGDVRFPGLRVRR
jgi:hypothetical protein